MTEGEPGREAPPTGLAELRRGLAERRGKSRVDLLLDQRDPVAAVQALPPDELFHAIQEAGLADAAELVQLASPDQFRTFLDLGAWRDRAFSPERALPWLKAARPPSLSGEEAVARWREKLAALDPELVSLLLRGTLRVHDLEEEPDPELEADAWLKTPDGRFVVEIVPAGPDSLTMRRLLDDLYAEDAFEAGRRLASFRQEIEAELAEAELRWRTGRLADLGFPPLEEALSWFARPKAAAAGEAPPGLPHRPPGFWLAAHRTPSLLDRAAARLPPESAARFEAELLSAANAVLVADRVDPSDAEEVAGALESARALLEMGLEAASGGDEESASAVLASTPLKRIFQRGFGQLLELHGRAARLAQPPLGPGPVLDAPLGDAVAALRLRRPRYFPGLSMPRAEWGAPATAAFTARPFRSTAEVREALSALEAAEGLLALSRRLGLERPVGFPGEATLSALYLTALANERLGRPFAATPIARDEVPRAACALEPLASPWLEGAGEPGELLATLARNRAAELEPLRAGEAARPGTVTALLVAPP